MRDILLVGCGNIGFRHLQALAALDPAQAGGITVIEPAAAHHARIRALLDDLPAPRRAASHLLPALPAEAGDFALAIIATNSADRRAAFDAARGAARFGAVVFEKVLFPRLCDLDEVAESLAAAGIPAHVNCPRRAAPGYRALRERLAGGGPVHLEVTGTAYGLASNAIHFLDLAEFLNGARLAGLDGAALLPGHAPSKRPGYVEIFGTLTGRLDNGAEIRLRCDPGDAPRLALTLRGPEGTLAVDEAAQTAQALPQGAPEGFAMRHVSELAPAYAELLAGRADHFVPYADSLRQHRHLLATVLHHLGRPVAPGSVCPIS